MSDHRFFKKLLASDSYNMSLPEECKRTIGIGSRSDIISGYITIKNRLK